MGIEKINKKIKVCYVVAADITLKFLLLGNIKFLMGKGYDVHVVCSPGKWLAELESLGITVKRTEIKRQITPIFDLISLLNLFWYFKKEKFDMVHTFTPKPGLIGQLAAKLAGVPIIVNTIFGFYFHDSTSYLKRKFYILIEKISGSISDVIFFRNEEDFKTARIEKIGTATKNKYLGDGIDIVRFNPEKFSKEFIEEKKKKLGINLNVPIIGIVARLVKEKGYVELFLALKKVLEKFPNVILLAVGPEDLTKKDAFSKDIVKEFGIEKNVLLLGERTDVDELFSLMDVFVLPSHREGFSHSIMEASAMALPIIASDIRGCRGAIDHGSTGILIPPRNVESLANAIIYFLENPDIAKKMGQAASKKAEREFNESVIFEKTEEEYRKLSEKKL